MIIFELLSVWHDESILTYLQSRIEEEEAVLSEYKPEKNPNPCENFVKNGVCKYGKKCHFDHIECKEYKQGHCRRGLYCMFRHNK